jgi:hypothetical protein
MNVYEIPVRSASIKLATTQFGIESTKFPALILNHTIYLIGADLNRLFNRFKEDFRICV